MHSKTKLIDIDDLKHQVEKSLNQSISWFYSEETGSTNSDLLKLKLAYSIALSESQNSGRGQRNNSWLASYAENLLFSIALPITIDKNLALMPLKIGLAIKAVLNQAGYKDLQLKWPNDIFYQQKKLGGILIESISQDNEALVIIGVGLNINMPYKKSDYFISLIDKDPIDRTPLLAQCILSIFKAVKNKDNDTVNNFNSSHLFHLKPIRFNTGNEIISGICHGINQNGQLLIEHQGKITEHSVGRIIMDDHQ